MSGGVISHGAVRGEGKKWGEEGSGQLLRKAGAHQVNCAGDKVAANTMRLLVGLMRHRGLMVKGMWGPNPQRPDHILPGEAAQNHGLVRVHQEGGWQV